MMLTGGMHMRAPVGVLTGLQRAVVMVMVVMMMAVPTMFMFMMVVLMMFVLFVLVFMGMFLFRHNALLYSNETNL